MNDVDLGARLRQELGLLTEDEIAAVAGVKPTTVRQWRTERDGPPYVKMGQTPLYRRESLLRWLAARERAPSVGPDLQA